MPFERDCSSTVKAKVGAKQNPEITPSFAITEPLIPPTLLCLPPPLSPPINHLLYGGQAPVVLRDGEGVIRAATVDEERGMSYADENLFRRDVRRSTALRQMD